MNFRKYQSVAKPHRLLMRDLEKYMTSALRVFPKVDGANASVWLKDDGTVGYGSRNRDLSVGDEGFNGFKEFVEANELTLQAMLEHFEESTEHAVTIYGEWMVPHSVKDYEEYVWKKFWIFDVMFEDELGLENYIPYIKYEPVMSKLGYSWVLPQLAFYPNGLSMEAFAALPVDMEQWGIKEGKHGEGVVVKCYEMAGRKWLKSIHPDYNNRISDKPQHKVGVEGYGLMESKIMYAFMDGSTVEKEYQKIINAIGVEDANVDMIQANKGQIIPRLMNQTFNSFVEDNMMGILKKFKNPTIDFKVLRSKVQTFVREAKPEIF